jgi:hypothetical protein
MSSNGGTMGEVSTAGPAAVLTLIVFGPWPSRSQVVERRGVREGAA